MADDEEVDLEALMRRSTSEVDVDESRLREHIINKGRKLSEAVEKREKARLTRDSAVADYEEACREVEAATSVWRSSLTEYEEYVGG